MKLWPFRPDTGGPERDRDPDDRDQDPPQDRHDVSPPLPSTFVTERCRWSCPCRHSQALTFPQPLHRRADLSRAHRPSSAQVPPDGQVSSSSRHPRLPSYVPTVTLLGHALTPAHHPSAGETLGHSDSAHPHQRNPRTPDEGEFRAAGEVKDGAVAPPTGRAPAKPIA
jgi:hypothetical protein